MNKISHIHYTDAYYIYAPFKNPKTTLPHNECIGYLEKGEKNTLIIRFVIQDNNDTCVIEGLAIPDRAILSKTKRGFLKGLNKLSSGTEISVTWQDVTYLTKTRRNDCSIMYTEGLLFKNNKDHLVLKDPETLQIYPTSSIRNHPPYKPFFYVIPKSFIIDFEEF